MKSDIIRVKFWKAFYLLQTCPLILNNPFLDTWSTSELTEMIYQMGLFAVGTPLNAVALLKFSRSSKKRNSSEFRLIRLSRQLLIAHLMVLCIYCVWRTYWFYHIAWTQGDFLCKVYSYLTALPFHLWSNMVAAIAVDMLYCIVNPLSSVHNGNKRVSWLIGGTVQIPDTEYEQCYPLVENYDSNILMGFHFFHVITTFYASNCKTQSFGNDNRRVGQNTTLRFLCATACIVCTFVLTWLPYQVMALLRVICEPDSNCEIVVSKFSWLQAILISSTCINPFLYNFGIFKSRSNRKPNLKSSFGCQDSAAGLGGFNTSTGRGSVRSVNLSATPKSKHLEFKVSLAGDAFGATAHKTTPLHSSMTDINGYYGYKSVHSPKFVNYRQSSHAKSSLCAILDKATWSILVAILFLGAIIGSLSLRQIADKLGRKKGLILAYFISAISVTISIFSYFAGSFELYAGSRLLLGFSLGLSLGLGAIYLTECSPKNCRGIISMTLGVMVQLGTVVGSVIAMPQMLCSQTGWWRIYGIEVVILLLVLTLLPFVHESPGFLILKEDHEATRHSIKFFYHSLTDLELKKYDRRGTLAGCVVAFSMAFSGIAVINAFAVEIFRSTGLSLFDASMANVCLSVISLLSCITSSFIIDRFGRRRLLLLTVTILLFVNLSICSLMYAYQNYGYDWLGLCLIAAISVFIFAFATGPGPLCFFITSEMVSQNSRSAGQSWATLVQMTSRTILLTIFYH
uniref:Uncharacterized protein n=1 Tax=Ditylenchus dipsaci TaxID=166011 RepID=A0A915D9F8_9BILA